MKELKIGDLNKLYTEAESADKEVFAEQRSNILLIAGDHYNRHKSKVNSRIRDTKDMSESQKLRITKNHLHRVYRNYVGNILSYAPGVTVVPANELEIQDQKVAELNKTVWEHAKDRHRLKEKIREFCQDYIGIGECWVKIFFDPNKGDFMGMAVNEEGEEIPQFSGDFVFERVFGFNLMRAPGAKSMSESPYYIVRKMAPVADLKKMFSHDPDLVKGIVDSKDDTYVVFDVNKGEYQKTKDQALLKEFYWKPCFDYPKGYFAITTGDVILAEGELPYGIFPIVGCGFDEYPTSPRARSIIKQLRPMQGEINRAASATATHQVTLGDDKIVYQGGSKLQPGALLPGVRGIAYNSLTPPTILPGRDGGQFLPYIQSQIEELYTVAEMSEDNAEKQVTGDPYALLFASLKQKKKYAIYAEKFEQFLVDVCETYLKMAKIYLSDDQLILIFGRREQINLPEFRSTTKLCYQIDVEEQEDTLETQLGKQLSMNHVLQYVGSNLEKDDIGKIIRNMPYANVEESFRDLTLDYDCVKNDFLMIERGQMPQISDVENHEYILKRVASRLKEPDFKFLPPEVQQLYQTYKQQHEFIVAEQAEKLMNAKNEFIPVGGALIAADLYIPGEDPSKAAKRVRVPYQALDWLVQKLEAQGMTLDKLEKMNPGVVSDMASMIQSKNNPAPSNQMSPSMAMGGAGPNSPIGVS